MIQLKLCYCWMGGNHTLVLSDSRKLGDSEDREGVFRWGIGDCWYLANYEIVQYDIMHESPTLTIREEQVVQALLLQQYSPAPNHHPDDEIESLIHNLNLKNKHLAQDKLFLNRGAINIEQEDFNIDSIILQVGQLAHIQVEEKVRTLVEKQGFMQQFGRHEIDRLKISQEEFIEIEGRYPKVKECLSQKIQYPCVKVESSKVERWFAFNEKDISNISDCILFVKEDIEYRIYCIEEKFYCFTSNDKYCEPLTQMPNRNKQIVCLSISACKKYLAVGLTNELVIYEINSPKSFSLIKNITDIKVQGITAVGFCGNGFERVYVVDSNKEVLIVGITNTFIFYRVEVNRMDVCLTNIVDADYLRLVIDEDEFHILAFSSNTEVAIYLVFPFIQLLHIENFEDDLAVSRTKSSSTGNSVDEHRVNIKWRYKHDTVAKPQLIITFWNRIIVLKMVEANNDVVPFTAKFVRFLYFTNHYPILSIGLISYNHLLIQSTNNTLIIAIPLITSSDAGEECEESSIIYVDSCVYQKLFRSTPGSNKLILASESKLEILQLIKLQDYIDHELSQKSDYMNIFSLLLLISKGLNYCFVCDYQEKQLTKIIFYCVENLLVSLSKIKTDENSLAIRLYWACQLLIESSRQHLIWSLVFSTVKNTLRKCPVLFICLEGFFMKGMIHSVPPDIFNLIVENYLSRNRSKLLLKSIMNLDLEEHNVEKYLEQINEREMYSLFIYLFQNLNEEGDYLTPFVKLFARFQKSEEVQKKEYLGRLCLWYLYKSLRGVKFPEAIMSWEEKQLCFQNLLIQPLNPIFSKPFLEFSDQSYLTIYLFVCTNDEIIKYINKNSHSFLSKLFSFNDKVDFNQNPFKQIVSFVRQVYGKESTAIHQFVSLCSLKNPVDPELLYQTCLYYLCYPNLISQDCLWLINPIQKDTGKILLQMLIKLKGLLKSNKLYLKKLMAHKSYHWQVVSYLHSLDGKYKIAIQSLLDSQKRDNIFILIKEIIKEIEDNSASYRQMQGIINFEVGRLIRVSPKETLSLLKQFKIDIQNVFKQSLKQLPELKLQLITSIITDNEKEGIEQNTDFLVEHLELVCQFDKVNLMKYLNHINYPLDDCAKICERHNEFEGKAFIQGRSGDILGSLHSYQKAIITKLKDTQNLQPHILKPLLHKYFSSAVNLCRNNPCSSVTPVEENNWLCLMEIIKDIQDHKYSQKVDVMVELNSYFNLIYQQLFNHVPAKILLEYFLGGNRGFLPRILLKSWYSLSILFRFQHSMYKMAIETNVIDTTQIMDIYSSQKWKGIFSESTQCCFCDNPLVEERQLVFFSCRHFFHKICHKNKLCLACKFESDSLLVKSMLDKMMSKRKQSQSWSIKPQPPRALTNNNGVIYIQLQPPEERNKRLKQKLKSFQFQKIKNDQNLDQSFLYYFSRPPASS